KSLVYSFFASAIFLTQGRNIGAVLCPSDTLVGETLVKMFPVIPFIYLEIILESIIKGLGRQNFSTVNSLCEYAVRILCVIIFVHFYGFTGVLISYYASNILSNIIRIIAVCRWSGVKFSICDYLMKPFIFSAVGCLTAELLCHLVNPVTPFISAAIYISCAGIAAILAYEADKHISAQKCTKFTQNTDMCN
ncbi:MAG: polysaccharide biosynthesis C-terminal domain-containing protein, partial [Oscillospiraceae bacterium]